MTGDTIFSISRLGIANIARETPAFLSECVRTDGVSPRTGARVSPITRHGPEEKPEFYILFKNEIYLDWHLRITTVRMVGYHTMPNCVTYIVHEGATPCDPICHFLARKS